MLRPKVRAEPFGQVGEAGVVVLVDLHRSDPAQRDAGRQPPESVHHGGADDDERDDAEDQVDRDTEEDADQDGGDDRRPRAEADGTASVRGDLARVDLGRTEAGTDIEREGSRLWSEGHRSARCWPPPPWGREPERDRFRFPPRWAPCR